MSSTSNCGVGQSLPQADRCESPRCKSHTHARRPPSSSTSRSQMMIKVRPAKASDAVPAMKIVRQSIRELCVADHHADPGTLDPWLVNKTPANFASWMENPENLCVVGELDGVLAGVGLLHRSGEDASSVLSTQLQVHYDVVWVGPCTRCWRNKGVCGDFRPCTCAARLPLGLSTKLSDFACSGPQRHLHGRLWCFPYRKKLQPDNSLKPNAIHGSA